MTSLATGHHPLMAAAGSTADIEKILVYVVIALVVLLILVTILRRRQARRRRAAGQAYYDADAARYGGQATSRGAGASLAPDFTPGTNPAPAPPRRSESMSTAPLPSTGLPPLRMSDAPPATSGDDEATPAFDADAARRLRQLQSEARAAGAPSVDQPAPVTREDGPSPPLPRLEVPPANPVAHLPLLPVEAPARAVEAHPPVPNAGPDEWDLPPPPSRELVEEMRRNALPPVPVMDDPGAMSAPGQPDGSDPSSPGDDGSGD